MLFRLVQPWGRSELELVVVVVHRCGLCLWKEWHPALYAQWHLCLGVGLGLEQSLNQRRAPEGELEVESFGGLVQCPW